jgi:hypothetical protein
VSDGDGTDDDGFDNSALHQVKDPVLDLFELLGILLLFHLTKYQKM